MTLKYGKNKKKKKVAHEAIAEGVTDVLTVIDVIYKSVSSRT